MFNLNDTRCYTTGEGLDKAVVQLRWIPLSIVLSGSLAAILIYYFITTWTFTFMGLAFFAGIGLSVMYWSYMAPRWRLWALPRVPDPVRLMERAVAKKLIWPEDHIITRLEWRFGGIRGKVHRMYRNLRKTKLKEEEVETDYLGEYYELNMQWRNLNLNIVLILSGLYVSSYRIIPGLVLAFLFAYSTWSEWKQLKENDCYLRIDPIGITSRFNLYPWQIVRSWMFEPMASSAKSYTLVLTLDEGLKYIPLDTITDSPLDIEKIIEGYFLVYQNNYSYAASKYDSPN